MRTTLSLDDDVSVMLTRVRKQRGAKMKSVVNEALRRGLTQLLQSEKPRKQFSTGSVDLGRCRLPSLDNVAEGLAVAEGDDFR